MTFEEWYERENKGHTDEVKADMKKAWDAAYQEGWSEGYRDGRSEEKP